MRTIHTLLALTTVIASWVLTPLAQGTDIRLANGIRLHYETSGIGTGSTPVVLLHGYGMSSEVWEKAMPLFPSDYRWLAVDLRGFGRSDKPEGGYGCPELAEDIAAFLDGLELSQAVLIGHSFGGLVVQHFAARHPERVLALVLSNTFAATLPPKGLTPAIPAPQHAAVRAPVLILEARHDPFGAFDQAVAMSDAFPNSRIQAITRSGHTPMWEKPSDFAGTVAEFLKN